MRIAIGGISHETTTFVSSSTHVRDFEAGMGLFRGDATATIDGCKSCKPKAIEAVLNPTPSPAINGQASRER